MAHIFIILCLELNQQECLLTVSENYCNFLPLTTCITIILHIMCLYVKENVENNVCRRNMWYLKYHKLLLFTNLKRIINTTHFL